MGTAAPQIGKYLRLFVHPFRRYDRRYRLPDDLFGPITEHAFSAGIPGLNNAIQVFRDDGISGILHNRGQPRPREISLSLFGHVTEHQHRTEHRAVPGANGRGAVVDWYFSTIF